MVGAQRVTVPQGGRLLGLEQLPRDDKDNAKFLDKCAAYSIPVRAAIVGRRAKCGECAPCRRLCHKLQ